MKKSKRRKSEWMSIDEAIKHIMKVEKCSEAEAEKKLFKAMLDGKIESRIGGSNGLE